MKRPLLLTLGAAALVVAAAGLHLGRQQAARTAWAEARPEAPDLAAWPAAFGQQVRQLDGRIAAWPPAVEALAELTLLYHANGFADQAEAGLRGLVRHDPDNPRWPHLLGVLLAGTGRLEEARPLLARASELKPDHVPSALRLGDVLLKLGDAGAAATAYRRVLALDAHNAYAMLGLARLDVAAGRWSAARLQLEAAAVADPQFSGIPSLLATVYDRMGNTARADEMRERTTALGRYRDAADPWIDDLWQQCFDPYRLQVTAATLASTGRLREAVPVLERAARIAPGDARTLRQLAGVYLSLREVELARGHLEQALERQPDEPAIYLDLVSIAKATNDAARAAALLERGLEACPDSAGLHFEYGLLLASQGRERDAIPEFRAAIRLKPEENEAYRQAATLLFKTGQPADGIAVLRQLLARDPRYVPAITMLVRRFVETGDRAAAGDVLRQARATAIPAEYLEESVRLYERAFGPLR